MDDASVGFLTYLIESGTEVEAIERHGTSSRPIAEAYRYCGEI
jgi:hypothetical protein